MCIKFTVNALLNVIFPVRKPYKGPDIVADHMPEDT